MSEAPHWTEIVAAIVAAFAFIISVVSAVIAWKARQDSKNAGKIARSDFLRQYFDDIQYLWEVAYRSVGREEKKVILGQKAIHSMKAILSRDQDLIIALDRLLEMVGNTRNSILEFYDTKDGKPPSEIPTDASDTFATFERKRCEYLGIN